MARRLVFILPAVAYALLIVAAVAGQQPRVDAGAGPTPSPPATPTPTPTPTSSPTSAGGGSGESTAAGAAAGRSNNIREGIKIITEGSRAISGWALLLIGASVVAIVSTTYMRPLSLRARLSYLLFIPGWILVGFSTYYGDLVSRRYMAAALAGREEVLFDIFQKVNGDFASQLYYFQRGLLVFSLWLVSFLLWWVFGSGASTNVNK